MEKIMTLKAFTVFVAFISVSGEFLLADANANTNQEQTAVALINSPQVIKSAPNFRKVGHAFNTKFRYEDDLAKGEYIYIIELNEPSIVQEPLALAQLLNKKKARHARVNGNTNSQSQRFQTNDSLQVNIIEKHLNTIANQQTNFLKRADLTVYGIQALDTFQYAINALAVRLTQEQAQSLAALPQVKRIERERILTLDTDRGPTLIGSPLVWQGTANPNITQTQGEGMVIGIIDSGINTDHPSFAEVAGDGYVHSNPLGNGVFLGDCARNFASLCNNKLIGVYSYNEITNSYSDTDVFPPNLARNGEDYDGHGSHVASTAAGNILRNVAEVTPDQDQLRSSGTPTGFTFSEISGVAPRANIISYQACFPGSSDNGDTYSGCPTSASLRAIDDAIRDNVDVINYSISGGGEPWQDSVEQAFFAARSAGIFVATSAGNNGSQASTSNKNAPWYTSVAASEHGRQNIFAKQLTNFTGGSNSLAALDGQSNSGTITAPIVYAGDFTNSNDPNGDSAQCLQPFPSGTFNGQIVVCDRGEIARVQKAINVRDGGAAGYVLANIDGGTTFLANDQYVIPGIHINAENGNALKAWLNSGTNHRATITTGIASQFVDEDRVDVITSFSSRGPNTTFAMLIPTLAAPGNDIYAAYADEQLGHDGEGPAPSDYHYLSGTSMSSPHVAGAAALIKSVRPNWDPDQIRSALSFTANINVQKEDATSPADFFDMGAGRIQVDKAIASGLVMSETTSNYTLANPARGGDPRTLNIPSITDNACEASCVWSRTFTATTNATWTFSQQTISNGLVISASPSAFTLQQGQTQTVEFTINNSNTSKENYSFGLIKFSSPGLPDVNLPVATLLSLGNIPTEVTINSGRDIDSVLIKDVTTIDIENFVLRPYKPVKATSFNATLTQDPTGAEYLDNIENVSVTEIVVPENAQRLIARIAETSADDMDLYLLFDANENGSPSLNEEVAQSTLSGTNEEISINFPSQGTYFVVVQNFNASNSASDQFELRYAVVTDEIANEELFAQAPSQISNNTPFDLRIGHNLPNSLIGDEYYAAVGYNRGANNADDNIPLGLLAVDINRLADDVSIQANAVKLNAGETASATVVINANNTNEQRLYEVIVAVPVGTEITNFSNLNNGTLVNNQLRWEVLKESGDTTVTTMNFDLRSLQGAQAGPIDISAQSRLLNQSFSRLETSVVFRDIQVEGGPSISFNGNETFQTSATEGTTVTIPLDVEDPNNDELTIVWTQTAGPTTNIIESFGNYTFRAPNVDADSTLSFDVTVTDTAQLSAQSSISIQVINANPTPTTPTNNGNDSGGGGNTSPSLLFLLLGLIGWRYCNIQVLLSRAIYKRYLHARCASKKYSDTK